MEPITRKEKFYAAAAGDVVALPEPVSRDEKWLHRMATRFGDSPTGGDTLTWDGNTEGLLRVEVPELGTFYKVSDVALSNEEVWWTDLAEGGLFIIKLDSGETIALCSDANEQTAMFDDLYNAIRNGSGCAEHAPFDRTMPIAFYADYAICVWQDNFAVGNFVFPEKGIYFNEHYNVRSFCLPNCTKFPSVKPVEGKYLFGGESEEYPGCLYRKVGTELEWLNPPMVDGEVYRTMERHDGLPVYTAKVHAELPADVSGGGILEVPFDFGGGVPFSVSGNIFMSGAYFALPLEGDDSANSDTTYCRAFVVGDVIIIPYGSDAPLSNGVVTVTLKWVKPEQGMQTFNIRRPQPSKWVSENAIVIDRYVKQPKTWEEIKQERMGEAGDL